MLASKAPFRFTEKCLGLDTASSFPSGLQGQKFAALKGPILFRPKSSLGRDTFHSPIPEWSTYPPEINRLLIVPQVSEDLKRFQAQRSSVQLCQPLQSIWDELAGEPISSVEDLVKEAVTLLGNLRHLTAADQLTAVDFNDAGSAEQRAAKVLAACLIHKANGRGAAKSFETYINLLYTRSSVLNLPITDIQKAELVIRYLQAARNVIQHAVHNRAPSPEETISEAKRRVFDRVLEDDDHRERVLYFLYETYETKISKC
jgi:hypothetical protein